MLRSGETVNKCKKGKYFSLSKVCQLRIFGIHKLKSVHCAVAVKSGVKIDNFRVRIKEDIKSDIEDTN